jgi:hypothetical protein
MTVSIPWSADLLSARSLQVNGFDMLYDYGSFI